MSIRAKMVLLVLPLIIAPLLLTGYVASLSARNGITSIATSLLRFKMDDLLNYANGQWSLLVENNFVDNKEFVQAARQAVTTYAASLVRNGSELIFALDPQGRVVMSTSSLTLSQEESQKLDRLRASGTTGWRAIDAGGVARVAETAPFAPFGWQLFVTERTDIFYKAPSEIFFRTALILSVSLVAAIGLLVFFSFLMTQPLRLVANAMREIISTNDLSRKVDILYRDETGDLGRSFNLMTEELDKAYGQIKGYALEAAIAQHKEQKIRNIFQKYVPKHVIDEFFARPEAMLVGREQTLAVLFSDIRGFTTISEGLPPDKVVESLNDYFARMVEIVLNHFGIADKYIGDALMAFYGAPHFSGDEAFQAVMSGLEMLESLDAFNIDQRARGRPPFRIGIGINYGNVLVGNIGSEKKMDYTVVGDMVNVASRLEGITKVYKQELIVSDSIFREIKGKIPCRYLGNVVVKGKTGHIGIYAPKRVVTNEEANAWKIYEKALVLYYKKDFEAAKRGFEEVFLLLPGDVPSAMLVDRCDRYIRTPPSGKWTGAEIMSEK